MSVDKIYYLEFKINISDCIIEFLGLEERIKFCKNFNYCILEICCYNYLQTMILNG